MDFATMTTSEIMDLVSTGKLTKAQMAEAFSVMASVASAAQNKVRQLEEQQRAPRGKRALEKEQREKAVSKIIEAIEEGNHFATSQEIGEMISWLTGSEKPVAYATVRGLFKDRGYDIWVRPVFVKVTP